MTKGKPLADFEIKINGNEAPLLLRDDIRQIIVETSLHAPGMFELHVFDHVERQRVEWLDAGGSGEVPQFEVGVRVLIAAQPVPVEGQDDAATGPITLIEGEVTTIEADFAESGRVMLIVRGYDKSHRLHRGRKSATFVNMTDSEIADKVGRAAGLRVQAQATKAVHDYVLQFNQTDMEFLQARARRVGYDLAMDDKDMLVFGSPPPANTPGRVKALPKSQAGTQTEMTWGKDLHRFHVKIGSSRQASAVAVRGWNANTRQMVEAVYEPPDDAGHGSSQLKQDLKSARKDFGEPAEGVVVRRPVTQAQDAEAMAASLGRDMLEEFVEASGVCAGNPLVRAGAAVRVAGVGARLSGTYRVTSATHTYRQDEEYVTEFAISSRNTDSFTALLRDGDAFAGDAAGAGDGRIFGVVDGVVTNINDKDKLGRVKVTFPWMGDAPAIESAWCRVAAPMAGPGRGWMTLPEINDEVLIAFEHGDPAMPYVLGGLWNNRDKPPVGDAVATAGDKVNLRVWRSRSGHMLIFDDTDGKEKVTLRDKNANRIEIDSKSDALLVDVSGDLAIKCKAFSLDASANCTLKGKKFDFNNGDLEIG